MNAVSSGRQSGVLAGNWETSSFCDCGGAAVAQGCTGAAPPSTLFSRGLGGAWHHKCFARGRGGGHRAGDAPPHTTAAGFSGVWLTDRTGRGRVGVTRRGDSRENILQGVKGRKCASSGESVPQKRNSHSSLGRPLTRPPPAPGPEPLVVG